MVTPASPEYFGLILGHLSSEKLVEFADATSTGTKMPRTNWSDIARYKIALPGLQLSELFTSMAMLTVERIIANIHEVRSLAAVRDTLLPKLISGELRVSDAERFLERAL